jgi:hypothetical protein
MRKIVTGLLAGLFLFLITRTAAYLLGLDVLARRLAQNVLQIPTSELYLVAWLVSGLAGLIGLALWLTFKIDERLSNILSPRPEIGSLPIMGDPTLNIEVNRTTGKNNAELFVDLINNSHHLLSTRFELKATVNGKDLDRPITGEGFVHPNQKTRLFARINDVPMHEDLLAWLEYDVTYSFNAPRSRRTRRTAKGIEWRAQKPQGQPGPRGGKVVKPVTVSFYRQVEE